MPWHVTNSQ